MRKPKVNRAQGLKITYEYFKSLSRDELNKVEFNIRITKDLSVNAPFEHVPMVWLNGFLLWGSFATFGLAASVSFDRAGPAMGLTLAYLLGTRLLSSFDRLDKNQDQKLSRYEWEHSQAAAGGSGGLSGDPEVS